MSVPNALGAAARARPAHPALLSGDQRISYADLRAAAARRAGALAALGHAPGERIALLGPPGPDWVISLHAIGWLGATAAPISPRLTPRELERALEKLAPTRVLTAPLGPEHREALGAYPSAPLDLAGGPEAPERDWPLEEIRVTAMSSGSTGSPKAIDLTTRQLTFSALGSALRLGHDPGDTWLCCLPLNHVGGLSILLRCALYATSVRLHPSFDAAAVARALDGGAITQVSLVPAMLRAVLDARPAGRRFPPRLRVILLGGGPAPAPLLARCRAIEAPVALTWGMTETASQVATRHPGDLSPEPHAGPPLAFARVRGEGGVLAVEGPVAPGGCLLTRDRGALDSRGRVVVRGRIDDVIISGGENIDPREVEAALEAHEAVAEAAVVGRPDPRWGRRPVAWLVAVPGVERPDEEALIAWCRARLAGFKIPDAFRWTEALPKTELGKRSRTLSAEW